MHNYRCYVPKILLVTSGVPYSNGVSSLFFFLVEQKYFRNMTTVIVHYLSLIHFATVGGLKCYRVAWKSRAWNRLTKM